MSNIQNNVNRLRIAFFDYPDVFEDFYTHYGVDHKNFSKTWHNTGNHAWLKIVQEEIGDVTWYVLSIKPEVKEDNHDYVGCKIKFINSSWIHRKCWNLFYLSKNSWKWQKKYYNLYATFASYLAIMSFTLVRVLLRDKPDVFFVQEYSSGKFDVLLFYSWLLKIPIVALHAGSTPETYTGKRLKKITIPKADHIFSSGENEKRRLICKYNISHERISIIRPPVDINTYKIVSREIACNELQLNPENRYIIFIGRLDDTIKRVSSIIKCIQRLNEKFPDIHLLIVGTGSDENNLKNLASKYFPTNIHFLGWVGSEEKKALLLNVSECLVLASKREGFPVVIGEAFACGIPVISSDVGTISDLVLNEKTGWLFPSLDDESLYQRLFNIAANPNKVRSLQVSVRRVAEENVSFQAVAAEMKRIFSSLKIKN